MAVDLNVIYDQKKREFRQSNATERFNLDFIDAANRTVKELSLKSHDQTEIADISAIDTSIDIDSDYHYVVGCGISYFLALMGQKPQNGLTIQTLKADWEDERGNYNMNIINDLMDTASNDIIGLGATGTNNT